MYKFASLLLLIVALTAFCLSCRQKEPVVDIGSPVITGSPILVLNP
ncbi:MAG: hypothetical protein M3Q06_01870 [Bacteroidota bacterium]|nr:hypothetical protein [Bacteroidota bacterium]